MRKYIFIILFGIVAGSSVAQQDPQYNLYQFNPLIINPAYAGARDGLALVADVRQQWVGFSGAPKTNVISGHAPILNKNVGVGLTLVGDRMGPRNMVGVTGNFSYILKLNNKWKLSLGLSAGYNRYQFNYQDITFKNIDNTNSNIGNITEGTPDFGFGVYLKSKSFFFGSSFTHVWAKDLFNQPVADSAFNGNISYRLRTHNFITIGKSWVINENCVFAPTIAIRRIDNNGNMDLNFNFFIYKKLWIGAFYRIPYGPGFLLNYYVTPKCKLGYSYDTGVRDQKRLGPSHEVSVSFDFLGRRSKIISPRFL